MTRQIILPLILWVLAFACSLPLIQPPQLARLAEFIFLTGGIIACAGVGWTKDTPFKSPLVMTGIAFWAWAAVSLFWTPSLTDSLLFLGTFSALPVTLILFSSPDVPQKFFKYAAIITGIIIAALSLNPLAQYFVFQDMLTGAGKQPFYPFNDPNSYAAFLSLGFIPSLALVLKSQSRAVRNLCLALCILIAGALIVLGGRGPILCLIVATAFFLWLEREHIRQHAKCLIIMAIGIAAIMVLAIKLAPSEYTVFARIAEPQEWQDTGRRGALWGAALAIARDHLPLGTGFGSFFQYYPQYRPVADTYSSGLNAHNDALQFLVEMGPIAVLLFYGFFFLAARRMVAAWRAQTEGRTMALALFCSLGAMIVHTHVNFNFYIASILMLAGLMLAYWHRLTALKSESAEEKTQWFVAAPAMIVLIGAGACSLSEYYVSQAKKSYTNVDIPAMAIEVEKANAASFGMNARPYLLAGNVSLDILEENRFTMKPEERKETYDRAKELFSKAIAHNPRLVAAYYDRARLNSIVPRNVSGDTRDAMEQDLMTAIKMNPLHVDSRTMLAKLYFTEGKIDEAYSVLKEIVGRDAVFQGNKYKYYAALAAHAEAHNDKDVAESARKSMGVEQKKLKGFIPLPGIDFETDTSPAQP